MKNIFVLPTDKPTNIYLSTNNKVFYSNVVKYRDYAKSQHIYIPSDEKPKEGDWVITPTNDIIQWAKVFQPIGKKIILTTDPTLIADGVQAIDDEFLQWFIKNPSCVFVEVSKICQKETISEWWTDLSDKELREVYIKTGNFHLGGWGHDIGPTEEDVEDMYLKVHNLDLKELNFNVYYKIIIPSEEPKQDRTCSNNCSVVCGECQIFEPKQEFPQLGTKEFNNLASTYFGGKPQEEPKQETTLEEAYLNKLIDEANKEFTLDRKLAKDVAIKYAKWQQEQDKKMYSEKEMLDFSEWVSHNDWVYLPSKGYWVNEEQEELEENFTTKELFEQFKNK
jgi:hypothetical protein